MNKQKNKKKVIAFLLSMLMLISLFQNISYTPVAEAGEPERVASESDAVSVEEEQDPVEDEQAGEVQVQSYQMPQDVSMDDLRVGDAAPVFTVKDYSIKTKGPNGEYTEEITDSSTVYADQDIKLSFNWELTDGELTEGNREFIIPAENIAAAGISIPAGTRGVLREGNDARGEYVVNANGSITITFNDSNFCMNKKGRSGTADFEGKIENSTDKKEDNTKKNIKFGTASTSPTYYLSDKESSASVNKWQQGSVTRNSDGKLEVTFRVNVNVANGTVTDLNLNDTPDPAEKFASGGVTIVDSNADAANLKKGKTFASWNDAVAAIKSEKIYKDENIVLEYKMLVDEDALKTASNYKNRIQADYTNNRNTPKQTNPSDAYLNLTKPSVSKTGVRSSTDGYVTWTITVKVGDMYVNGKTSIADYVNSITDVLGSGLKNAGTSEELISKNWIWDADKKEFTYTYDTEVDPTVWANGQVVNQTVQNKVTTEFVNGDTKETTGSYTITPTNTPKVTKKFKSYDPKTGVITWNIKITDIPTSVYVTLVENTVKDSLGKHEFVPGSCSAMLGSNITSLWFTKESEWSDNYICDVGRTTSISLTVKTKINQDATNSYVYRNNITLKYGLTKNDPAQQEISAYAEYVDTSKLLKKESRPGDENNTIKYVLSAEVNPLTYDASKSFVFKDTLDSDMELAGPVEVYYGKAEWEKYPLNISSVGKAGDDSFSITVPYSDEINNYKTQQEAYKNKTYIYLVYTARLKDKVAFVEAGVEKTVTNNASATYGGDSIGTATTTNKLTPEKVVTKTGTYNNRTAPFINYKIDVNKNAYTLNNGTPLQAVDTLGDTSVLKFAVAEDFTNEIDKQSCKVSITSGDGTDLLKNGTATYTVSQDRKTMEFTIPDATYVIITYSTVAPIDGKTQLNASNSSNKFQLGGTSQDNMKDVVSFNQTSLIPSGTAVSKVSSIEIQKFWQSSTGQQALTGSEFSLESVDYNPSTGEFTPKILQGNEDGSMVKKCITLDSEGKVVVNDLYVNQLYVLRETKADSGYALNREPYYFYVGEQSGNVPAPEGTKSFIYSSSINELPYENKKAGILEVTKQNVGQISDDFAKENISFAIYTSKNTLVGEYKLKDFSYDSDAQKWVLTLNDLWPDTYKVIETSSGDSTKHAEKVEYLLDASAGWVEGSTASVIVESEKMQTISFKNTYKEDVTTTEETTTTEVTTTEVTTTEAPTTTTEVTTAETTTTQETTADSISTTEVVTTETSTSTTTTTTTSTTTTTATSSTTETKTGDAAPVEPITVVMLTAAVGIIILGIYRKKKDEN